MTLSAPDLQTLVTFLPSLALAVGLAASAGLRAWLPLLATGVLSRAGVLTLGDSFGFLSSTPALVLFGVATVLEVVADKVPALDHGLDAISTVLRPVAGTVLASAVLFQVSDPLWALALGLMVGAPTALVPHAAKSGLRLASSTTTAGIANPVISVLEDVGAIALVVASVLVPVVAALVVCAAIAFFVRLWRRRTRGAREQARAARIDGVAV